MATAEPTAKTGWKVKSLGDLCDIARGGSPRPIQSFLTEADNGINWIKIGDATASEKYIYETKQKIKPEGISRSRMVEPGDFLLSNSMSFGRPYIMKTSGCIHDGWLVLSDKSGEFDPDFLYHYLGSQHAYRQFDGLAAGSTVRNLNIDLVRRVTIPVPPLAEQERIVGILDEAFEGIAAATAQAEKNLHNARELFQSVLQSTFSQKGDDWVETEIGDLAEVFDGPHATPKTVESGPVFLGIAALQDGELVLGKTRHVTPDDYVKWTRRVTPQADDVVFSYETRLGQAAIIPEGLECCLGRRMGLVRLERQRMMSRFFVFQYVSPPFREYLDSKTIRGATVDRIPLKEFPAFKILVPPLPTQQAIVEKLDALSEETKRLEAIYERKQAALSELKQSLLQKAFAGEL